MIKAKNIIDKDKAKNIINFIYCVIIFTIMQSLIIIVGFSALYVSLKVLVEKGLINWKIQAGLTQGAFGICYLQVWNFMYWIFDINIFNNKLFKDEQKQNNKTMKQ